MKIIVTGCAGFVGARVCEVLVRAGHEVLGIDDLDKTYIPELKLHRLERLRSLGDYKFYLVGTHQLHSLKLEAAGIIHLAARAGVRQSVEAPEATLRHNLDSTLDVLAWARQRGAWWIFASSSSVYSGLTGLHRENLPISPATPYALSKAWGEQLGKQYWDLYQVPGLALRLFSVYGPAGRPDSRASVYRWCDELLRGQPVTLGCQPDSRRDFTFIDDVAQAFLLAAERLQKYKSDFDIFNVGAGQARSCWDVADFLRVLCGVDKQRQIILPAVSPTDTPRTLADTERTSKRLGWEAGTLLSDGLSQCVEWHKQWLNDIPR